MHQHQDRGCQQRHKPSITKQGWVGGACIPSLAWGLACRCTRSPAGQWPTRGAAAPGTAGSCASGHWPGWAVKGGSCSAAELGMWIQIPPRTAAFAACSLPHRAMYTPSVSCSGVGSCHTSQLSPFPSLLPLCGALPPIPRVRARTILHGLLHGCTHATGRCSTIRAAYTTCLDMHALLARSPGCVHAHCETLCCPLPLTSCRRSRAHKESAGRCTRTRGSECGSHASSRTCATTANVTRLRHAKCT